MPDRYRYINEQADWDDVAPALAKAPRLALDTERNGRYAYRERICLIQISDGKQTFLLDPLAVGDLTELGRILGDPNVLKALHGSEEDIRFFDRDFGFAVSNLFDTGMAARFLGVGRPNLGAVLEEFCGVAIPKDRKMQMSHWGLRPLSRAALDYAAGDVHHLLTLVDELDYRLAKTGRQNWVQEECERISALRYPPEEPLDTAFRRVKGWEALNLREMALLRELYAFRDDKACAWDVPVHQVASNDDLLALAQADGEAVRGIGGMLASRCAGELGDALKRGMECPESPKPERTEPPPEHWSSTSRDRLKELKRWRGAVSEELGMAVSHIWPTPSLERIALRPETMERELAGGDGEVRRWQRAEFGDELASLVAEWELSEVP